MCISDFRRGILLAVLILITPIALAEQWQNPADRYEDAYKAYLDAACPIAADQVSHFVYFARDRGRMRGHPFLEHSRFEGAQIMYPWRALERAEGDYDFSIIRSDVEYLKKHGKQLRMFHFQLSISRFQNTF